MCSEMMIKILFPGKESRDCADDWHGGFCYAAHFSGETRFQNSSRRPTVPVFTCFCSCLLPVRSCYLSNLASGGYLNTITGR